MSDTVESVDLWMSADIFLCEMESKMRYNERGQRNFRHVRRHKEVYDHV